MLALALYQRLQVSVVLQAIEKPGQKVDQKVSLKVVIATRESRLALWQAEHVKALLENRLGWQVELLGMTTLGDQILDRSLSKVGAFAKGCTHGLA